MTEEYPEKIGQYDITGILGSGGMSTVYEGMQSSLNRKIAIKVLPLHLAEDDELVDRFEREASIVANLNHPNIIQIFDRGTDAGQYFIVMEYIEGCSLDELIEGKKIPVYQEAAIALQVAKGMEYAHSKGVVHRDIKPPNILISSDSGTVKITDFGIAKLAEDHLYDRMLTREQVAIGTADYMSPEQRRDSRSIDGRSDIFSFGVLLYEMHTGRIPVGRFREPYQLRDDTPPLLNRLILQCLHDHPEDRYQTFTAVIADLNKLTQKGLAYRQAMAKMSKSVRHMRKKTTTAFSGRVKSPALRKGLRMTITTLFFIVAIIALYGVIANMMKDSPPAVDAPREILPVIDFTQVDVLVTEKKYDEALALLNGIRESSGGSGDVRNEAEAQWRIANIQEERGRIRDAGISYGDFADKYGESADIVDGGRKADALFRAGMFMADDGDFESAVNYLARLRTEYPLYSRGEVAMLREIAILNDKIEPAPEDKGKHYRKIVDTCRTFKERFPESLAREDVFWRQSRSYAEMGNRAGFRNAVDTLEEMARDYPQSIYLPLFEAAKIAHDGLGDENRARQLIQEFLDVNPDSDKDREARDLLNSLKARVVD